MAIFTIPKYKIEELEKKINRIKQKGADVIFDIVEDNIIYSYRDASRANMISSIICTKIDIRGEYIINGWTFVATIEHSSPENIIRIADEKFTERIPEKYRTVGKECEHCYIRRDRSDTFLIYNEDEDDWKQVGRTCLKNYTQGLDAEVCASIVSILAEITKLADEAEKGNFDLDLSDSRNVVDNVILDPTKIKKQMVQFIKDNGYIPSKTVAQFKEKLVDEETLPEATAAEIQEITEATKKLAITDWSRNAIAVWNKEYIEFRDLALLASLCSICLQKIAKEIEINATKASATNTYAGEVGDEVKFEIKSSMVAYTRTPSYYNASPYPVYRLTDDTGKIYMWGCSNPDIVVEPGKTIKGKIKSTYERKNGEKITELTRCKIF